MTSYVNSYAAVRPLASLLSAKSEEELCSASRSTSPALDNNDLAARAYTSYNLLLHSKITVTGK